MGGKHGWEHLFLHGAYRGKRGKPRARDLVYDADFYPFRNRIFCGGDKFNVVLFLPLYPSMFLLGSLYIFVFREIVEPVYGFN